MTLPTQTLSLEELFQHSTLVMQMHYFGATHPTAREEVNPYFRGKDKRVSEDSEAALQMNIAYRQMMESK